MVLFFRWWLFGCLVASALTSPAQTTHALPVDALGPAEPAPTVPTKDIADVARELFPHLSSTKHDTAALRQGHKFVSVLPAIGYALQTRFLAEAVTNVSFQRPQANLSTILSELIYTQNRQGVLTIASSLWARDNRLNWVGDWRLMHFPEDTYGLGTRTARNRPIGMNFDYLRFYQAVLRRVTRGTYVGIGYQLDYHWNVARTDGTASTPSLGYTTGVAGRSMSAGPTLHLVFDSRANSLNPQSGLYSNVIVRSNVQFLGSDTNYQSLLLEVRKYFRFPSASGNVLAFWSYNWLTLSGTPPYLDLPSTGWDTYGNIGRGFIQGRFRGRNLLYGEAEYRFGITHNRLLGGVVFLNAQSASEEGSHQFEKVVPAVGAGLRINVNKASGLNLAVDYGFGADGSQGLFFNLGEVF